MISLKRTLDRMEQYEMELKAALNCNVAAITSIEKHILPVREDLVYHHRRQLRTLRRKVVEKPAVGVLQECSLALDGELKDYCEKGTEALEQRDKEIRDIVSLLADGCAALTSRNEVCNSRLKGFTRQLESIAQLKSLTQVRRKLTEQVGELRVCVDEMWKEGQSSVDQLRKELRGFQQRLTTAEQLACTDPLTGAVNRREGEKQLEDRIRSGQQFCVMVLDLDRFKMINDRFGHQWGDQVLKTFARRLSDQVRPQDVVCRWGGDEFLVILECSMRDAMNRSKAIAEKCGGEYRLGLGEQELRLNVCASVGATEYRPDESSEQLFSRADALLYHQKGLTVVTELGAVVRVAPSKQNCG